MKRILTLALLILMTACSPAASETAPAVAASLVPTPEPTPISTAAVQVESATPTLTAAQPTADGFPVLAAPVCTGFTPENQEGPYYTPNTPERNSLLEDGMQGEVLKVVGYVLDANCQPIANAWLDFWQADANGEYDNAGYILRGHQFTDSQGRYQLETIMPGLYSSRPIRHIHVKVQPPGGGMLTTQLYFPEQPIEGLTVELTQADNGYLGVFNFVVK